MRMKKIVDDSARPSYSRIAVHQTGFRGALVESSNLRKDFFPLLCVEAVINGEMDRCNASFPAGTQKVDSNILAEIMELLPGVADSGARVQRCQG
jgi:hypothetical protein